MIETYIPNTMGAQKSERRTEKIMINTACEEMK